MRGGRSVRAPVKKNTGKDFTDHHEGKPRFVLVDRERRQKKHGRDCAGKAIMKTMKNKKERNPRSRVSQAKKRKQEIDKGKKG